MFRCTAAARTALLLSSLAASVHVPVTPGVQAVAATTAVPPPSGLSHLDVENMSDEEMDALSVEQLEQLERMLGEDLDATLTSPSESPSESEEVPDDNFDGSGGAQKDTGGFSASTDGHGDKKKSAKSNGQLSKKTNGGISKKAASQRSSPAGETAADTAAEYIADRRKRLKVERRNRFAQRQAGFDAKGKILMQIWQQQRNYPKEYYDGQPEFIFSPAPPKHHQLWATDEEQQTPFRQEWADVVLADLAANGTANDDVLKNGNRNANATQAVAEPTATAQNETSASFTTSTTTPVPKDALVKSLASKMLAQERAHLGKMRMLYPETNGVRPKSKDFFPKMVEVYRSCAWKPVPVTPDPEFVDPYTGRVQTHRSVMLVRLYYGLRIARWLLTQLVAGQAVPSASELSADTSSGKGDSARHLASMQALVAKLNAISSFDDVGEFKVAGPEATADEEAAYEERQEALIRRRRVQLVHTLLQTLEGRSTASVVSGMWSPATLAAGNVTEAHTALNLTRDDHAAEEREHSFRLQQAERKSKVRAIKAALDRFARLNPLAALKELQSWGLPPRRKLLNQNVASSFRKPEFLLPGDEFGEARAKQIASAPASNLTNPNSDPSRAHELLLERQQIGYQQQARLAAPKKTLVADGMDWSGPVTWENSFTSEEDSELERIVGPGVLAEWHRAGGKQRDLRARRKRTKRRAAALRERVNARVDFLVARGKELQAAGAGGNDADWWLGRETLTSPKELGKRFSGDELSVILRGKQTGAQLGRGLQPKELLSEEDEKALGAPPPVLPFVLEKQRHKAYLEMVEQQKQEAAATNSTENSTAADGNSTSSEVAGFAAAAAEQRVDPADLEDHTTTMLGKKNMYPEFWRLQELLDLAEHVLAEEDQTATAELPLADLKPTVGESRDWWNDDDAEQEIPEEHELDGIQITRSFWNHPPKVGSTMLNML